MNNFFRRTITGAGIVIFVMGGFWLHPVSFFLTGLILLIGTQSEYYSIIRNTGVHPQTVPGLITGVAAYVIATLVAAGFITGVYFLVLIPMVFVIMVYELYREQERPFDSLAHKLFPLLYAALPFSLFPFAARLQTGLFSLIDSGIIFFSPGMVIGFFILIWANDTGAYLTGISFGRHKLMERISPKKTWEGFAGGALVSMIVAWLLSGWIGVASSKHWIAISLIISIAGTYGDLIESMLKRSSGIKDSGSVLPGHGGFLDRFDSTLVSFPLVYLFVILFGY